MGMFDTVRCERSLPDGWQPGEYELQTKDFDCYLELYVITSEGRLLRAEARNAPGRDVGFHGYVNFYGIEGDSNNPDARWHEYNAKFTNGNLDEIELVENKLLSE